MRLYRLRLERARWIELRRGKNSATPTGSSTIVHFSKTLAVLTELDTQFPNHRHILLPMARCLARLRRNRKAADLAERIARDVNYDPARDLRQRLMVAIVQNGKEPPS